MLEAFAPSLYVAQGPTVSFLGFPYDTRMVVVRLGDGSAWVWSPIELSPELELAVEGVGPVRNVVSPNKLHNIYLSQWSARWPQARLLAPPGLAAKRPQIRFGGELGDEPDPEWAADVDQVVFRGSLAMEEVVFFHRASRTAIVGDLVQRQDRATLPFWKGLVMRLDGMTGEDGSTPREWRATFLRRGRARAARDRLLGWKPQGLVIAHGRCAREGATGILSRALAWI